MPGCIMRWKGASHTPCTMGAVRRQDTTRPSTYRRMRWLPGGRADVLTLQGCLAPHEDERHDDHEVVDGGILPIHERSAHGRLVIPSVHWEFTVPTSTANECAPYAHG